MVLISHSPLYGEMEVHNMLLGKFSCEAWSCIRFTKSFEFSKIGSVHLDRTDLHTLTYIHGLYLP